MILRSCRYSIQYTVYSYAELRGNNICWKHEEQSRIRSRSRRQMSVDYIFRSIECKSPGDVADMGILMMSVKMISQQSQTTSCRKVAYVIGGIYDVIDMEWSVDTHYYLADHSSILKVHKLNSKSANIFRLFL